MIRWLAAGITTLLIACGETVPPTQPVPTSVSVTPGSTTLTAIGASGQLSASDQNGNPISESVTWRSDNPSVAVVNSSGLVTAVGNGASIITATVAGASGTATVAVEQVVSSVQASPSGVRLESIGAQEILSAVARDAGGTAVPGMSFGWTSSAPGVAEVTDGVVTAVGNGVAQITASVGTVVSNEVPVTVSAQPLAYTCTLVIGYSQTSQWFSAGFETVVDDDTWQAIFRFGGAIDLWTDPNFDGWSRQTESPCAQNPDAPDRVLLSISADFHDDPSWWVGNIGTVLDLIRDKYPAVRLIVLEPVVGGPGHAECPTNGLRASQNHPVIDEAIAQLVGGDVAAGLSPEVRTCSDYADFVGHLTPDGAAAAGAALGTFHATN